MESEAPTSFAGITERIQVNTIVKPTTGLVSSSQSSAKGLLNILGDRSNSHVRLAGARRHGGTNKLADLKALNVSKPQRFTRREKLP